MIRRSATLAFAFLAAALAAVVVVDVLSDGRLTLFSPALLAGFAVIGIGLVLSDMATSRTHAQELEQRTGRLMQLAEEREGFTATLEAANARLRANEARYKGLIDVQADAIMRCTPDRRVTYANESFYRLFARTPENTIGQPFAP